MVLPFLAEGKPSLRRIVRTMQIAEEVEAYLDAVAKLAPYASLPEGSLRGVKLPELPPRPDPMNWLDKMEAYGLPNPGTWLDQPAEFLEDMEGVRMGRQRHNRKQQPGPDPNIVCAGAPAGEPLARRDG